VKRGRTADSVGEYETLIYRVNKASALHPPHRASGDRPSIHATANQWPWISKNPPQLSRPYAQLSRNASVAKVRLPATSNV